MCQLLLVSGPFDALPADVASAHDVVRKMLGTVRTSKLDQLVESVARSLSCTEENSRPQTPLDWVASRPAGFFEALLTSPAREAASAPPPLVDTLANRDLSSAHHGNTTRDDRGGARGPCNRCEHFRQAASISRAVFDVLLDVFKPTVMPTQTRKMQEEVQAIGEFSAEIDRLRKLAHGTWSRRPSAPQFHYCGVEEFENNYHCCDSPSGRAVIVLEHIVGKQLREAKVLPSLQAHAENEYQDCC